MKTQIQGHAVTMYQRGSVWWYSTHEGSHRIRKSTGFTDIKLALDEVERRLSGQMSWNDAKILIDNFLESLRKTTARKYNALKTCLASAQDNAPYCPDTMANMIESCPKSYQAMYARAITACEIPLNRHGLGGKSRARAKYTTQGMDMYGSNDLNRLESNLGTFPLALFQIMVKAGLRPGEACALSITDIFMDSEGKPCLSVSKTRLSGNEVGETKSSSGTREISIPAELAWVLRTEAGNSGNPSLIFPKSQRQYQRLWKRAVERAGLLDGLPEHLHKRRIAMRCLRKTALSNMAMAGVDPLRLAKVAGHSDVKITMQYYLSDQLGQDDKIRNSMMK